ncbi:MAG: hypothetical protein ACTSU2_05230 [Promethearchaeota archaeon]
MSNTNQNIFQIMPLNYPNNILLGTKSYELFFQCTNLMQEAGQFQIGFTGEGLDVKAPKELQKPIEIGGNQSVQLKVSIKPQVDGLAKIIINTIQLKKVEYTELEWQLRPEIDNAIIDEALSMGFLSVHDINSSEYDLPVKINAEENVDINRLKLELNNIENPAPPLDDASAEPVTTPPSEQELDNFYSTFAIRAFNTDYNYALSLLSKIKNPSLKEDLLKSFILPLAAKDIDLALQKLNELHDDILREQYLIKIIYHVVKVDKNKAITLVENVKDELKKQEIITDIAAYFFKTDSDFSLNLVEKINDPNIKFAVYWELIKEIYRNNNREKCTVLINKVVDKAIELKNTFIIKYCWAILGKLTTPKEIASKIENLPPDLKDVINKELYNYLWHQVEVKKERIDQIPVSSVYYAFHCVVNPNQALIKVAELGGNISENLLIGDFSSFIGIICPFSFEFPIFPVIEQCYAEIKYEKQKSFYYMLIPTKVKEESELAFIEHMLKEWFVKNKNNFSTKVYLFNLDFIPYLSKPTIIMGSDESENLAIQSIVKRVFKDDVTFIIDEGLFKGGMVYDFLVSILPSDKFKIINLVMTYDFLNNYILFKNFMNEFVK